MDLVADAIMNPSPESMGRVLIQQGIMRAIFCPYSEKVLDVSTALAIGPDYDDRIDPVTGDLTLY